MEKEPKKNRIISVNGRYFNGFSERPEMSEARRYTRDEARILNRVVMCGRGKIVMVKEPK